MNIAVTGATGFIGRHVLAYLSEHGINATAVVRPTSSKINSLQAKKIVHIDMHKPPEDAFECMGYPDALIHLAWDGLPNYKSLHHFENELPAQYQFLKSLISSGLQKVTVAGTCFEYGMQCGPLSIKTETKPNNPYGFAKNNLRQELQYLQNHYPFILNWARIFYIYGEGQAENSLFSQLKRAAERGDKVFNMSGGEQLRDYLSVSDVAKTLISLTIESKYSSIVNVCSGKPISIRTLVEEWKKKYGWEILLNFGYYPYPDYEPLAFWGQR